MKRQLEISSTDEADEKKVMPSILKRKRQAEDEYQPVEGDMNLLEVLADGQTEIKVEDMQVDNAAVPDIDLLLVTPEEGESLDEVIRKEEMLDNLTKSDHECEFCFEILPSTSALAKHKRGRHSVSVNYVCMQCGKMFKYEGRANEHIVSHSKLMFYQCTICLLKARWEKTITEHRLYEHQGEGKTVFHNTTQEFYELQNLVVKKIETVTQRELKQSQQIANKISTKSKIFASQGTSKGEPSFSTTYFTLNFWGVLCILHLIKPYTFHWEISLLFFTLAVIVYFLLVKMEVVLYTNYF